MNSFKLTAVANLVRNPELSTRGDVTFARFCLVGDDQAAGSDKGPLRDIVTSFWFIAFGVLGRAKLVRSSQVPERVAFPSEIIQHTASRWSRIDEGERITDRDSQNALLKDWHLQLSAGQYRAPRDGRTTARRTKLVHNIVLSMPSPTPPDQVLAAARKFASEKFALQHRYAMVIHTDRKKPPRPHCRQSRKRGWPSAAHRHAAPLA